MRITSLAPILFVFPLLAQDAPIVRAGNFELGAFGGVSVVSNADVKGSAGGNVAYALTRIFMPYAEISYFPKNNVEFAFNSLPGTTVKYNTSALDYSGGLHVRVPIPHSRIVPYGIIGVGGFRYSGKTTLEAIPNPFPPPPQIQLPFTATTQTDPAVSYGGGIRYYAHEAFGFRLEAKTYQPVNSFLAHRFFRLTAGMFIQLK